MRIVKRWTKLFIIICLVAFVFSFVVAAASGDTIVYITNTGEKYHSYGCQYLRKSCIQITLSSAALSGYGRCSKCSPPVLAQSELEENSQSQKITSDLMEQIMQQAIAQDEALKEMTADAYASETAIRKAIEKVRAEEQENKEKAIKEAVAQSELEAEIQLNETVERIQKEHEAELKEIKRSYRNSMIWVLCLMGIAVLILLVTLVRQCRENRGQAQKVSSLQNNIKKLEQSIQDLKDREKVIQDFGGLDCRSKAGVPEDVIFGMDYIPVKIGGESCVVFLNKDMSKYHKKWCRYSTTSARNVFALPKGCRPCKVCNPMIVEKRPQWLLDYLRYIDTKKRLDIPDPDIPYPEYKE